MSNSTDTTGCISHKRHKRFFVMYEDYLEVASVSKHQYKLAAFWRVLETKTNDRITYNQGLIEEAKKKGEPEPETTLWIEVPYSEYVNRALGIYKSSSFQVAAAESERLGFSASRVLQRKINPQDPQSPKEDYKEYLYLTDRMQSVLDGGEYPTPIEINSPLLKGIEERQKRKAIEKNGTPIEINSHNDETPVDFNGTPLLKSTSNKYTDKNTSKDDRNMDSVSVNTDDTTLSPSLLSDEELLAEIQRRHLSLSQDHNPNATTTGQNDTPLTPAGNDTVLDGETSPSIADTSTDHTALESPVIDEKQPCVEGSSTNTHLTQDTALPGEYSASEMPSSTQGVDESNRQAMEQVQQESGESLIVRSTTNNLLPVNDATKTPPSDTTPVQPAPQKARGGRGKGAEGKEEKLTRAKSKPTGSPEAFEIAEMYCSLFKRDIPITQKMLDEAEKLVPCHPAREDIRDVRLFCYASNAGWYGTEGTTHGRVTMKDIVDNWAGWVASQEAPATGFQVPDELKDRVAGVYAALNEWRASKTGDAENVFVPDAESDQAICHLLQKGRRPTKKRMTAVCDAIWETPRNAKTGYLQREHMTVKMICLTYRERELDLAAKEQEAQGPKNIVDLFDANRTFSNGLTYLPGALPLSAKPAVMEG